MSRSNMPPVEESSASTGETPEVTHAYQSGMHNESDDDEHDPVQAQSAPSTKHHRRKPRAAEHSVKVKETFGRGVGRASGFYRQMETRADPEAKREAEKAAAKERRRQERRGRERAAQEAEQAREREAQRQENREENGGAATGRASNTSGHGTQRPSSDEAAAAPRRRRRETVDEHRCTTFAEYDAAFEAWQEHALRTRQPRVSSVPLPPKGHAPIAPASTPEEWHVQVKRAQLRWHPDKWAKIEQMLGDERDREMLKQITMAMFRAVMRCKEAGFRRARAAAAGGQE